MRHPERVDHLVLACTAAGGVASSTLQFFDGGHQFLLQDKAAWPAIVDFLADE